MTAVRLEPFRWWHIDDVLPIEADLFGAEKWSPAMFWSELANGHHYRVAVDADGSVLGYAGLAGVPPDEVWVQNIAVRRDAQRRGVGRTLLEELLAEAVRRDARSTLLEVAVDNAAAQRLYATYGFEPIGVRRGYYQPSNTDALVMRRDAEPTGDGPHDHG
ncbi:ribosomal protein S18-alanine N-acetyltransferase [Micromonospora sp. NIE79]|uniref:Ribosomal-protein-alanine N-acetyltransferase n=2 Tax=Micromonospora TaxID=1873 RepID=A0A328NJY6_9ACTN|nr:MULTISPECIES: ribosomal protein S18-alanine N-acetyltransferase [Micromonospora]MCG5444301.1 ribosomal protein S18-alanine N-acetyltransferase [Micromonospora trifolii]RAO33099.1 Ribosomal-protein-alanine N-acetyltransferase [Micromonospora saelicesensis]